MSQDCLAIKYRSDGFLYPISAERINYSWRLRDGASCTVVTGGPGGSWEGILMLPCSGAVDQAWCLIVHCSERVEALTLVFVHAE